VKTRQCQLGALITPRQVRHQASDFIIPASGRKERRSSGLLQLESNNLRTGFRCTLVRSPRMVRSTETPLENTVCAPGLA
jgi:hypothetical protein